MKVVHVLTSAATSWGGPPRAVRNLTTGLNQLGVHNTVVTLGDRNLDSVRFSEGTTLRQCGNALFGYSQGGDAIPAKMAIPSSPDLVRALVAEIESADIVHLHELWSVPHVLGGLVARIAGCPYIVSPHGELQAWALRRRGRLKRLAWHAYEKRLLLSVSGIHALTTTEERSVRQMDLQAPVKVIPNGIDFKNIDAIIKQFEVQPKEVPRSVPFVLYVGRLAAGKGLQMLLEAVSEIDCYLKGLSLVLVGPDERGLWPKLRAKAESLGIEERVTYLGVVNEPQKYAVFASAELFILPSSSEGLSVSLLEALACGTPVVITPGCNITQEELGIAGRVVDPNPKSIARAVVDILQDQQGYRLMRDRARSLAMQRYSSSTVASQMMKFYTDTLDREET